MTKTLIIGILILYSCTAHAYEMLEQAEDFNWQEDNALLQPEDLSWLETCENEEMPGISTKLPNNLYFIERWFETAYEASTTNPCDQPTLKYLSSATTTTEVRGNLVGLRSSVRDQNCRNKLKELLLQVEQWVKELKTVSNTNNCHNPSLRGTAYIVNSSRLNVREDPLTGTKSAKLDRLDQNHHLSLITRIIGNNGNKWGKFSYKRNGQLKFGWLNMKYTRPEYQYR